MAESKVWNVSFHDEFDSEFDDRNAIILVAADKQGVDENKFYKDLLRKANKRYDQHLERLRVAETAKAKTKSAKRKK
ncbi:hypothetical protein NHH73_11715 [Oxalobacteraceae bacterium OTU3CINTB1]|nr:hypothetical protein NHH73_11715 [Oxalobacteraceae bacterium OTU3CINTB1]